MRTNTVIIAPGAPMMYASSGSEGGIGTLFLGIFIIFAIFMFVTSNTDGASDGSGGGISVGGDRVSIVRLQVGLLGLARSLQDDLDAIADKADTSSPDGLHYVLQETVLALLRKPDFCVYGNSGNRTVVGPEAAEASFNELSLEERGKFENETLVNVNARKRTGAKNAAGNGDNSGMTNEFIVVTILVAADAPLKLPPVTSAEELQTALKRLGAVRASAVQAVEILWTPQEEGDTLTQAELSANYPLLNSL
jgi:uncharacterized membrane protein